MLMDAAGTRAVVEITPEGVAVRTARDDAALISTNHQRGEDADYRPLRPLRLLHDTSAESFGDIDVPRVESMLAGAAQGKLTMQSMVFEPANRVMYLSAGTTRRRRGTTGWS